MSGASALDALKDGNTRWAEVRPQHPHEAAELRAELAGGQHPSVAVLSCADSRVPPELVFDQGLGDLFTVRTAGQVLDEAVLGTLSFGVAELKIGTIVVLGHSACGAVAATVDALAAGERPHGHIAKLVDAVAPALTAEGDRADKIRAGVDANVRQIVEQLRADPELAGAEVVGARYDLEPCTVTFL